MDITLKNISKTFESRTLFENINLQIKQGDFIVITGTSGSGKTTLSNIIGGMEKPTSGEVIYKPKPKNLYRDSIGFIFQNYGLLENETILYNLKMAFIGRKKKNIEKICREILNKLDIHHSLNTKIKTLSGGEQQRIAIARILIKKPKVIIADEPTGNLDKKNSKLIHSYLKILNEMGITIILVTHKHISYENARIYSINDL